MQATVVHGNHVPVVYNDKIVRQFAVMTGYSVDELLERGFPDTTHPDDAALDVAQIQRLAAGEICSAVSGESDPAKSTWPAMNCSRPAPDPVGLYDTFLPGQNWPHSWLNTSIAFC